MNNIHHHDELAIAICTYIECITTALRFGSSLASDYFYHACQYALESNNPLVHNVFMSKIMISYNYDNAISTDYLSTFYKSYTPLQHHVANNIPTAIDSCYQQPSQSDSTINLKRGYNNQQEFNPLQSMSTPLSKLIEQHCNGLQNGGRDTTYTGHFVDSALLPDVYNRLFHENYRQQSTMDANVRVTAGGAKSPLQQYVESFVMNYNQFDLINGDDEQRSIAAATNNTVQRTIHPNQPSNQQIQNVKSQFPNAGSIINTNSSINSAKPTATNSRPFLYPSFYTTIPSYSILKWLSFFVSQILTCAVQSKSNAYILLPYVLYLINAYPAFAYHKVQLMLDNRVELLLTTATPTISERMGPTTASRLALPNPSLSFVFNMILSMPVPQANVHYARQLRHFQPGGREIWELVGWFGQHVAPNFKTQGETLTYQKKAQLMQKIKSKEMSSQQSGTELADYAAIDVRWVVLYGRDGNVKLTLCKVCKFVIILAVVSANDNKYPTKLI
jgi:hypothetical protein